MTEGTRYVVSTEISDSVPKKNTVVINDDDDDDSDYVVVDKGKVFNTLMFTGYIVFV